MFQSPALCSASFSGRNSVFSVEPGLIGRRLLAVAAAASFVAAIATLPRQAPGSLAPEAAPAQAIVLHASTTTALRDMAEAMRADMLGRPGVGAIRIEGLRQQALFLEVSPKRLQALGIAPADIIAAISTDAAHSRPGYIALSTDDMQLAANMPVHAGARVFRLGDVAHVVRVALDPPVSVMSVDGEPAARLTAVPARQ